MRVAYIINHLGQTGVNNVVLDLVKQMMGHGHECVVCYFEDTDKPLLYPCTTQKIDFGRCEMDFDGYDVVHTHGLKANLYVLRHKPRHCTAKTVATLHCYVFQDFKDLYGGVKGFLLGLLFLLSVIRHDKIVTLSKDAMQYYCRWICKKKLTYAYNTRDIDTSATLSAEEEKEVTDFKGENVLIGMNCVLLMRKGIDVMLKAMVLLPDNFKLFIVGDGKERDIFISMIKEYGLGERVRMTGTKPQAHRYLPYYDIYALPSRSEGFPLSLLEAAAYGRKVVASALPVITECFSADEVVTFDMPDERKLAEAIIKVYETKDLGKKLKKRFDGDYTPDAFYKRYLSIYVGVQN